MLSTLANHHNDWGPGPWLFPFIWLIPLTIGLLIWRFGRPWRSPSYEARSALAARYARGEIDEDEYRQRLTVLEEKGR
jgi:putative membrane protein